MKPIISVEGLGKSYTIRHEGQTRYKSLREELFKLPKRLLSRSGQSQEEFWALKDVNFDIMPGERVGILLPSSAGVVVTFYGLHAHGRTPVMLNFTSGERNLKAAIKAAGVKKVLTAKRFIDQAKREGRS